MSFHKAFLLILFIVMGSTLFSCKNFNDEYVTGEPVVVEDTIKNNEELLTGDTIYTPIDTVEVKHTLGMTLQSNKDSIIKKK